jgi:hypothetical protein
VASARFGAVVGVLAPAVDAGGPDLSDSRRRTVRFPMAAPPLCPDAAELDGSRLSTLRPATPCKYGTRAKARQLLAGLWRLAPSSFTFGRSALVGGQNDVDEAGVTRHTVQALSTPQEPGDREPAMLCPVLPGRG